MEYFKLENLKYFVEEADQKYFIDSPGVAFFKDTKEKLAYLINELSSQLNIPFAVNYDERPNKQPGRNRPPTLKNYILMGFIPKIYLNHLEKQVFVKIELDVKNRLPKLFIELDTNLKIGDNEYNDLKEELNKATHWEIPIDDHFPGNWPQLITLCLPPIKKCLSNLDSLVENKLNQKHPNFNRNSVIMNSTQKTIPLNQILYGPPGTGKTYNTINKALEIAGDNFEDKTRKEIKELFDEYIKTGQIVFTTFHQSMSYEDFIEGIKPSLDGDKVSYEIVPGIFKMLVNRAKATTDNFYEKITWLQDKCLESDGNEPLLIATGNSEFTVSYRGGRTFRVKPKASANPDNDYPASIENIRKVYEGTSKKEVYNPTYVIGILEYLYKNGLQKPNMANQSSKPYILIIDEINRGNVSQIFGELITLIEEDKRQGSDEALEVILPYSKDKFSVPQNLYIIGTMNTADRSVEALDAALRRRFSFTEMPPVPELIATEGKLKDHGGILGNINLPQLLATINRRIEKLLDKDHTIGHSYFIKVASLEDLKFSFQHEIIPLLQEYFYGDFGKIGLVLGKGFVMVESQNDETDDFADFEYSDTAALSERIMYKIEDVMKMSDDAFIHAISALW